MARPWMRLFGSSEKQNTVNPPQLPGGSNGTAAADGLAPPPPHSFSGTLAQIERHVAGRPLEPDPPFARTGPQWQRARMRDRLLTRDPDTLADHEMLEMLLYFAQSNGDMKPLAKELIDHFGSLAAVLSSPRRELLAAPGLGAHRVSALKLVAAAAFRLARAAAASPSAKA